jgi:uncharacterized protein YegP (UPF0339 family)
MNSHKSPRTTLLGLVPTALPLAAEPLVLELHQPEKSGEPGLTWTFRLKTQQGQVWMSSGRAYATRAQAEQGFFEVLQVMATNQYRILTSNSLLSEAARMRPRRPSALRNARRRRPSARSTRSCRRPQP